VSTVVSTDRAPRPPHGPPAAGNVNRGAGHQLGNFSRFALYPRRQKLRVQSGVPRRRDGGQPCAGVVRNHQVRYAFEQGIVRLRRLRQAAARTKFQALADRCRRRSAQVKRVQRRQRIGVRRRIGRRGTGRDHVNRIAHHVADQQPDHARRSGGRGQQPAVKLGEVLPNSVHLVDRGPRAQQLIRHLLQLRKGDALRRTWRERRSAPGNDTKHQVAFAGGAGGLKQLAGRRLTARIGHRMARLHHVDPPRRRCVTVLRDDQTALDTVAQNVRQGPRHTRAGLAGAQHQNAPGFDVGDLQIADLNAAVGSRDGLAHGCRRIHGGNSRPTYRHDRGAHRLSPHGRRPRPGQPSNQCRQRLTTNARNRPDRQGRDRRAPPSRA